MACDTARGGYQDGGIPAVAFIGRTGSGKTTLVVKVIERLVADGYAVASIKQFGLRDFDIDIAGKDSWRQRHAGACQSLIVCPSQMASIRTLEHELELDEVVAGITDADVVIAESHRYSGLPTIEMSRAANPRDVEDERPVDTARAMAVITDMPSRADEARFAGLPVFAPDDVDAVVAFIEKEVIAS